MCLQHFDKCLQSINSAVGDTIQSLPGTILFIILYNEICLISSLLYNINNNNIKLFKLLGILHLI